MSGIERLRAIAGAWDEWGLGGALADIADEIERERDAEVADSPYDAILPEDRDAVAWVREHGGLDHVRAEWRNRVPYDLYERRRQRLLNHIAECETALGRRNRRIEELGHRVSDLTTENAELRKRVMPEGCEWPTVDGRKVDFKTSYQPSLGVLEAVSIYNNGAVEVMSHDGIIKPVSEIHVVTPAADGEPLEAGQTVWHVVTGREYTVRSCTNGGAHLSRDGKPAGYCRAEYLTHQRPVLDADGVPIETCQKMWRVRNGEEVRVSQIDRGEHPLITYIGEDGLTHEITPDGLTHTKPEPKRICGDCRHWQGDPSASHMGVCFNSYGERCCVDSYAAQLDYAKACEHFEEDVANASCPDVYCANHHIDSSDASYEWAMARDIVRRAKALAGASE